MELGDVSAKADDLGRRADDSDLLDHAVRVGLVSYGAVHLLIAWLAFQLAVGDRKGVASGTGALHELAQQPFGKVLLWIVGVGFFALVAWQLVDALFGHRDRDGARRVFERLGSLGKAIVYGALGFSALKIVIGAGSRHHDTDTVTSRLMSLPLGIVLVAAVGVVVVAIAGAHVHNGVTERFRQDLGLDAYTGRSGRLFAWLGKVGFVSKGLALAVVGGLFIYAAWSHDPDKSGGLDRALETVLRQPFGAPLLILIAAGLGCYGLFCLVWAWHLDR